jgi:hypothetical protein
LRRLDQRHFGVAKEAHRALEEISRGNEVRLRSGGARD